MERKWELFEKFLDNELDKNEILEFKEILIKNRIFNPKLKQHSKIANIIKDINIPYMCSCKLSVMKEILSVNRVKIKTWRYICPIIFSYIFITTLYTVYSFKNIAAHYIWQHIGNLIVNLSFITDKIITVINALHIKNSYYILISPVISILILIALSPIIHRNLIKKEKTYEKIF
ncbi:hypothetical protein DRP43_03715 [candidate division TA06 bacterium]|uniref:Uncharacterized protein n=1 Tax=candidate division TA06 bacterium TaxID=2250710 RepID=A0A660SGZ5_UNCT6|nr:MAG: hypothetical protein DRP43_03715 [candidate division TA06 bacterium]